MGGEAKRMTERENGLLSAGEDGEDGESEVVYIE